MFKNPEDKEATPFWVINNNSFCTITLAPPLLFLYRVFFHHRLFCESESRTEVLGPSRPPPARSSCPSVISADWHADRWKKASCGTHSPTQSYNLVQCDRQNTADRNLSGWWQLETEQTHSQELKGRGKKNIDFTFFNCINNMLTKGKKHIF